MEPCSDKGGVAKAIFNGGGSESFAFLGTRFNLMNRKVSAGVSGFVSHTSGESLFQNSMKYRFSYFLLGS
jgi:hypothetical protein